MNLHDTIVAIATPPGRSGIGVVRLSGPDALAITRRILRFRSEPEPRHAVLADLRDDHGNSIDMAVATWFAAPRSYTADDLVEISCHGSPVVLQLCVRQAIAAGARPAEPGEFTLRAYLNGRIDLPRAEAVRDLIEATTLYQARVAHQQIEGSVSRRLRPLKEQLLELIALLEAGIDFAEDDIDVAPASEIRRRIAEVLSGTRVLIGSFTWGRLVNSGFTLAIAGRPNVGKSSLFNRLLERDRAIVTDIPGTTRDTVSETTEIGGLPVRFVDTAGIRNGADLVETLGIERTYQAIADADLTLVVLDASVGMQPEDADLVHRARSAAGRSLTVANKSDIAARAGVPSGLPTDSVMVSALTGQGIDLLKEQILQAIAPAGAAEQEAGFITSARHEALLRETAEALVHADQAVEVGIPHEMVLLDLYAALQPVDAITGATTADDILNRIFSTFCIGK